MARVGLVRRENSGRLAALADAPDGVVDQRLDLGIGDLAGMAERSMQVGRTDEHAVDAVDRADRFDALERLLGLDLDQQADLLVRAPRVVLDPPEARCARGAPDPAHPAGRVARI